MTISLNGKIDTETAAPLLLSLRSEIKKNAPAAVTLDLKNVPYLDDFGVLLLLELKNEAESQNRTFQYIGADERAEEIISLTGFGLRCGTGISGARKKINPVVRLGEATLEHADNVRFMIAFLGSVVLSFIHVCQHPKSLRINDTVTHMEKTGVDALPIVGLISFLLGLVIAFTSSIQLQQFGANIYVASLVVFSMVSELGPIMTAIIVAGRSGSAFAAEIGTMKISEEIDALFVMGFQPTLFLAVPRIIASIIVVPLLTLFSNIFAVAGGLVVGVSMLGLSPNAYITQTIETITLFEVMWGLSKSVVFASIIALIGCLRGFEAKGGASAVGNAATSAVVSSIFLIILFDSIFAVIRSYWG